MPFTVALTGPRLGLSQMSPIFALRRCAVPVRATEFPRSCRSGSAADSVLVTRRTDGEKGEAGLPHSLLVSESFGSLEPDAT